MKNKILKLIFTLGVFFQAAIAADIGVDSTFNGGTSKIVSKIGTISYGPYGMAVDSNSSIYLLSDLDNAGGSSDRHLSILKLLSNGSPDTSFDTYSTTNYGDNTNDGIMIDTGTLIGEKDMGILPDDSLIVANGNSLLKYSSSGERDDTFGANFPDTNMTGNVRGGSVAVSGSFIFYTTYTYTTASDGVYYLAKYNSDGTHDNTFNSGVTLTLPINYNNHSYPEVEVDSQGRAVVVGIVGNEAVINRFDNNGTLLGSYTTSTSGIFAAPSSVRLIGIYIDESDNIYIAAPGSSDAGVLVKVKADLSGLDTSFNTSGYVSNATVTLKDVIITSDDKIIAAGHDSGGFYAYKYDQNGSLDTSFNTNGWAYADIATPRVAEVDIDENDNIVVGGASGSDFAAVVFTNTISNMPATTYVTSISDSGTGSLRDAILNASDGDTIAFDNSISGQTITLSSTIDINSSIIIESDLSGPMIIDGNNTSMIFQVNDSNITLKNLVLKNGYSSSSAGGIYFANSNGESVIIDNCHFEDNSGNHGGAINFGGSVAIVKSSSFVGNSASVKGAAMYAGGTIDIINSTFYNNISSQYGGAIHSEASTYKIQSSTFVNNRAPNGNALYYQSGSFTLKNNAFYDTNASNQIIVGAAVSQGYNYLSNSSGASITAATGDMFYTDGSDPHLGTFIKNGITWGYTLEHDSALIDEGNCTMIDGSTLDVDQFGTFRPKGSTCDIGAIEYIGSPIEVKMQPYVLMAQSSTRSFGISAYYENNTTQISDLSPYTITTQSSNTTIATVSLNGSNIDVTSNTTYGEAEIDVLIDGNVSGSFTVNVLDTTQNYTSLTDTVHSVANDEIFELNITTPEIITMTMQSQCSQGQIYTYYSSLSTMINGFSGNINGNDYDVLMTNGNYYVYVGDCDSGLTLDVNSSTVPSDGTINLSYADQNITFTKETGRNYLVYDVTNSPSDENISVSMLSSNGSSAYFDLKAYDSSYNTNWSGFLSDSTSATWNTYATTSHLMLNFKGDQSEADISFSNPSGSGAPTAPVPEVLLEANGGVLQFNGSADVNVSIPDNGTLDPVSEITVEAWYYKSPLGGGKVVNKWDNVSPSSLGYTLQVNSDGKAGFYISTDGTSYNQAISSMALQNNTWHHLAGTYDGSNIKIFVNGVESNSTAQSGTLFNSTADLQINTYSNTDGTQSSGYGWVDEVRVWNSAKNQTEIQSEMNYQIDPSENSDLMAYYNFDERIGDTIRDITLNGNNGSMDGNVTRMNFLGNGLIFSGTSDNIGISSFPSIDLQSNSITVSAWIKASQFQSDGSSRIINHANSVGYTLWMSGGKAQFSLLNGGGVTAVSTTTIQDDAWHYLTGVFDGTDVKIYVDGVEEHSVAISSFTPPSTNNDTLKIGYNYDGSQDYNGTVSQVGIWDKALSEFEINQNMHTMIDPTNSSLKGYWPLNEGAGSVAYDRSTNGNNGTISGAAWDRTAPMIWGDTIYTTEDIGTFHQLWVDNNTSTPTYSYDGSMPDSIADFDGTIGRFTHIIDTEGNYTIGINADHGGTNLNAQFDIIVYENTDILNLELNLTNIDMNTHYINNIQVMGVDGNSEDFNIPDVTDMTTGTSSYYYSVPVYHGDQNFSIRFDTNVSMDKNVSYWYNFCDSKLYYDNNGSDCFKTNINSGNFQFDFDGSSTNWQNILPTIHGLDNGLVAYYKFEGDGNDSSGNGFNGNVFEATFTTGLFGQAASFDGSNDEINVTNISASLPGGNSARTISFWAKPSSTSGWSYITGYGAFSSYERFLIRQNNGNLGFSAFSADSMSSYYLNTTNWHHIVMTFDGTDVLMYANGTLVGTYTPTSINTSTTEPLYIGRANEGGETPPFAGLIDDYRLYNRALSPSEILDINDSVMDGIHIATPENNVSVIYTVNATDPEGDPLTYTLSGTDAADFVISALGELQFVNNPDYENPADGDGNNVYELSVTVDDGRDSISTPITVTVIDQSPEVVPVSFTLNVSDLDLSLTNITSISFVGDSNSSINFTPNGDYTQWDANIYTDINYTIKIETDSSEIWWYSPITGEVLGTDQATISSYPSFIVDYNGSITSEEINASIYNWSKLPDYIYAFGEDWYKNNKDYRYFNNNITAITSPFEYIKMDVSKVTDEKSRAEMKTDKPNFIRQATVNTRLVQTGPSASSVLKLFDMNISYGDFNSTFLSDNGIATTSTYSMEAAVKLYGKQITTFVSIEDDNGVEYNIFSNDIYSYDDTAPFVDRNITLSILTQDNNIYFTALDENNTQIGTISYFDLNETGYYLNTFDAAKIRAEINGVSDSPSTLNVETYSVLLSDTVSFTMPTININLANYTTGTHNIVKIELVGMGSNSEAFDISPSYSYTSGDHNISAPVMNYGGYFALRVTLDDGKTYWYNFNDQNLYMMMDNADDFVKVIDNAFNTINIDFNTTNYQVIKNYGHDMSNHLSYIQGYIDSSTYNGATAYYLDTMMFGVEVHNKENNDTEINIMQIAMVGDKIHENDIDLNSSGYVKDVFAEVASYNTSTNVGTIIDDGVTVANVKYLGDSNLSQTQLTALYNSIDKNITFPSGSVGYTVYEEFIADECEVWDDQYAPTYDSVDKFITDHVFGTGHAFIKTNEYNSSKVLMFESNTTNNVLEVNTITGDTETIGTYETLTNRSCTQDDHTTGTETKLTVPTTLNFIFTDSRGDGYQDGAVHFINGTATGGHFNKAGDYRKTYLLNDIAAKHLASEFGIAAPYVFKVQKDLVAGDNYLSLPTTMTLCTSTFQGILTDFCDQTYTIESVFGTTSMVLKHTGAWSYWNDNNTTYNMNKLSSINHKEGLIVRSASAQTIELPYDIFNNKPEGKLNIYKTGWFLGSVNHKADNAMVSQMVSDKGKTLRYTLNYKGNTWNVHAPINDSTVDSTLPRMEHVDMFDSFWIYTE